MGFRLYLTYLFVLLVRPIEQFAPSWMAWRPVLMLWVLTFVFSLTDRDSTAPPRDHRPLFLLGLLAVAVMLSRLFNGGTSAIAPAVADFSTPAMLFVLTWLNVNSLARFHRVTRMLLLCMTLLSVQTLLAYHAGINAHELVISQTANEDMSPPIGQVFVPADDDSGSLLWRVRSVGFMRDPNDFAQALVMVLPMVFMQVSASSGFWTRVLFTLPLTALFAWTLWLTHSRGGWIGAGVMLLLALRVKLGRWQTWGLALVLGLVYAMVGGDGRQVSTKEQSASERIDAWSDGLLMLKSNPAFGVGYGNFTQHHSRTAHNSFVLCFAELGLSGYFLWLALMVMALVALNRFVNASSTSTTNRRDAILLRASLSGFLVCAWFLSRAFVPSLYVLLALAICLPGVAQTTEHTVTDTESAGTPWFKPTLFWLLVSVTLASVFVRLSTA